MDDEELKTLVKKFMAQSGLSSMDMQALFKLLIATLGFAGSLTIYGGIVLHSIIKALRKIILDRSKSLKGEDVKNGILFCYHCF